MKTFTWRWIVMSFVGYYGYIRQNTQENPRFRIHDVSTIRELLSGSYLEYARACRKYKSNLEVDLFWFF